MHVDTCVTHTTHIMTCYTCLGIYTDVKHTEKYTYIDIFTQMMTYMVLGAAHLTRRALLSHCHSSPDIDEA